MDRELEASRAGGDESSAPILSIQGLVKYFPIRTGPVQRTVGQVHAVDNVSLDVYGGETVGIVGESGCGKSTLSRTVSKLEEPTSGRVVFNGEDITKKSRRDMRTVRQDLQIVFQDPYSSLDPRMRVLDIVREPVMSQSGRARTGEKDYLLDLLQRVGLSPDLATSRPRDLSGGQRQRVGIARALAPEPRLIILDEPVSALDVSIRAQVINLLRTLRDEYGLSYLFVAHDLALVRHACDRVAAMYLGKIVEIADRSGFYNRAAHPYTQALLSAVPVPAPGRGGGRRDRIVLSGEVPSPADPPSGCRFRTRCWKAQRICQEEEPALIDRGQGHPVACHFPSLH